MWVDKQSNKSIAVRTRIVIAINFELARTSQVDVGVVSVEDLSELLSNGQSDRVVVSNELRALLEDLSVL